MTSSIATARTTPRRISITLVGMGLAIILGSSGCDSSKIPSGGGGAVTGSIGSAGGTLAGPDGVQVVVPPGALAQPTTIGITRSSVGAPTALPAGLSVAGDIYEFTPHGLVFNRPVTVRMPVPANGVGTEVFMAGPGEDWQANDATVTGGVAEWQRNSFSWGFIPLACAIPSNSSDLYPCVYARGFATATATPAAVITRSAYSNPFGNAGSWIVNQSGTVRLTLNYDAAPDCGSDPAGAHVKLLRWNPLLPLSTPNRVKTLLDVPVSLTPATVSLPAGTWGGAGGYVRGVGTTAFDVVFSELDSVGSHAFGFSFSCTRPGRSVQRGGDLLTFVIPSPLAPIVMYAIGGKVSGLTGTVVLQNNGVADQTVTAPDSSFAFPPIVAGTPYDVTVLTQPAGQRCTVANASGTANAPVSNVAVTCVSTGGGTLALVANSGGNTLSIYRVATATGALTPLGTVATGTYPYRIAVAPNGIFAYVTNLVGSSVSSYSINDTTGVLTAIPLGSPGTTNPYGIAVDPLGRFVWVTNYSASTVSTFAINQATGALTAVGSPVAGGTLPYALAVHPTGNYVYAANESGNSVSVFSVNAGTGALTLLSGTLANSVLAPHGIAIDSSGQFAYAAASGSVAAFRINVNTGTLTLIGYINSNGPAEAVTVHPNGHFVYVSNRIALGTISVFSINPGTGALTQVGLPVATGASPGPMAINPAGTVLHVTNLGSNTVSTFTVDGATGALTPVGTAVATGQGPEGVAVTP